MGLSSYHFFSFMFSPQSYLHLEDKSESLNELNLGSGKVHLGNKVEFSLQVHLCKIEIQCSLKNYKFEFTFSKKKVQIQELNDRPSSSVKVRKLKFSSILDFIYGKIKFNSIQYTLI